MMELKGAYGDIMILGVIAGIIVLLLATMAVQQKMKAQQRIQKKGRGGNGPTLKTPPGIVLSPRDEQILDRLGWLFRNPAQHHRLLSDENLFLKAARRAIKEGIADEHELLALARTAGFPIKRINPDHMSTLKIPSGVEVSVADEQMNSGAGSIITNHPDALRLRLKLGRTNFEKGTRLDVVCNSNRGLYRFSSVVTGVNGKTLDVGHTDRIEHVQRRRHHRHGIQIPIDIRRSDGSTVTAQSLDLSIGGAAAQNPRREFTAGNRLNLSIGVNGSAVRVPAMVIRVSRGGRIIHLRFDRPDETTRHQIFRTIMHHRSTSRKKGAS
jgi:hypothetical protein